MSPGEGSRGGERGATLEAFIHIGTEQTGTTTIQAALQANRAVLASRGVVYLSSPGERDHRVLAACCMRANRTDDFFADHLLTGPERREAFFGDFLKRFAAEIAGLPESTRAVLVSSAHFHSRLVHTDEIEALRSLFAPFCSRVTIIVSLREQLDMARDSYATALRNGCGDDLSRFLLRRCRPENPLYNHYDTLRKWTGVFGRENVRARLFPPERLADGDLPRDFLDQVDPELAPSLTVRVPPQTPPPDAFGQCLLRTLNRRLPQRRDDGGRDALNLAITRLVVRRTANTGPWDAPVDPELAAAIRDRFLATNELVRRDYFPDRPLLFAPGEDGQGEGEPRLTREREELLGEVLGCFAEGLRSQARQLSARRSSRPGRQSLSDHTPGTETADTVIRPRLQPRAITTPRH